MVLGPWRHRLKFRRAEQHLRVLQTEVQRFKESGAYSIASDFDPKTGDNILRIKVFRQPPTDWQLIVGDCLYNLRASLDYLAFELADGEHAPSPETIFFPICRKEAHFGASADAAIDRMPPGAQASIKGLQPYNRREQPWLRELSRLHDFCNIDKHRLLHTTGMIIRAPGIRVEGLPLESITSSPIGPLEDGTEVGRFRPAGAAVSRIPT